MARILLVDDEAGTQKIVQLMLRAQHDVVATGSAEEAYEEARTGTFDAALVDIALGGQQTGVEVMQNLRTTWDPRHVPVIACTAYVSPGEDRRLLEQGFDGYLAKPFSRSELREALAQVKVT